MDYIGYKVRIYQHFDDEPSHPFVGKIVKDYKLSWLVEYKNNTKIKVSRKVNKACCSTTPLRNMSERRKR